LLSNDGQCQPPYEPDLTGNYNFVQEIRKLTTDRSLGFLVNGLLRTAIDDYLMNKLATADYQGMDIAKTPNGTQMALIVEEPSEITGTDGVGVQKLNSDLRERFGFEKLEIDVQQGSIDSEDSLNLGSTLRRK
jgi:ribosomal protein S3